MPLSKKKPAKKPAAAPAPVAVAKPAAPAAPPVDPASLARRKRALLDIVKDPDTSDFKRFSARAELTVLADVPILSHHELARLG